MSLLLCQPPARATEEREEDAQTSGAKEIADRRAEFRRRISEDRKQYSDEQLGEIETLYQAANKQWNTPEAKESLKTLTEKHPKANRAGCAVLYLAQMSDGEEREKLLKLAIGGYGDCFYGNGVQVGSCARWYLAFCYKGNLL